MSTRRSTPAFGGPDSVIAANELARLRERRSALAGIEAVMMVWEDALAGKPWPEERTRTPRLRELFEKTQAAVGPEAGQPDPTPPGFAWVNVNGRPMLARMDVSTSPTVAHAEAGQPAQAGPSDEAVSCQAAGLLSDKQIASACLSMRHDFGLLDPEWRAQIIAEAREWERAFSKEREASQPTQAEALGDEAVSWGVDWGVRGDRSCVSIIKRLPDGTRQVLATEFGPPADRIEAPRERAHVDKLIGYARKLLAGRPRHPAEDANDRWEIAAAGLLGQFVAALQQTAQAEAPSVTTSHTVNDLIAGAARDREKATEWQQWVERGGYDGDQQAEAPSERETLTAVFLQAMEWGRDHWSSFSMRGQDQQEIAEQFADKARAALATQQAPFMQQIAACKADPGPLGPAASIGPLPEHAATQQAVPSVTAAVDAFGTAAKDYGVAMQATPGDTAQQRAAYIEARCVLLSATQQAVQAEPVAAQHRFRHPQKGTRDWSEWQPCRVASRPAWEIDSHGYEVEYRALGVIATPPAPGQVERKPMTDAQIEKLREATFSTNNPFCPVDSKSMRKAVRAAEGFHRIRAARSSEGGAQ